MKSQSNRRQFLQGGVSFASVVALANPFSKAFAASCGPTPPQAKGPFYPGESQFHQETDLTSIPGHSERAKGQVIYVLGKVVDQHCRPVSKVNVEIWQACTSGKYKHRNDPNTAVLDPHFKYWAETYTNENGEYLFKTIRPGSYPADEGWTRPPHIHFKVSRIGYHDLITQMYFKGDSLNDHDLILQGIPARDKGNVIIDFQVSSVEFEEGSLTGHFDITLQSIRS